MKYWRVLFLAVVWLPACEDVDDRPARWSYIQPAIIEPSCATSSCHSALSEVADLDFSDLDESYERLLQRQYVIAGDPESALLNHLRGGQAELMPPDAPLPLGDQRLIEAWILDGAPF